MLSPTQIQQPQSHSINAADPYTEISEESGDGYDNAPLINPPIEGKNIYLIRNKKEQLGLSVSKHLYINHNILPIIRQ